LRQMLVVTKEVAEGIVVDVGRDVIWLRID
jgi:hypothetical protein